MRDFYERFYAVVNQSQAHAHFCERAFGRNLCQHGFADMGQLDALLAALQPTPQHHLLDLGCGNGLIAEYISDVTGAHVTGLDYISAAIEQAQARTAAKADRLSFQVGELNALDLPAATYDAILAIDTIYFSNDYAATIRQLVAALRPGGRLAFYYAYGIEPGMTVEAFRPETLAPARTPLAEALQANGLTFTTTDFTNEEYRLAQLRKAVLTELEPAFAAEEILFLFESRMGEAQGISHAIEQGLHRRYLVITDAVADRMDEK
ncbi:MAG: methyltransferase domain-containing protein [Caldilineaceae bacterium]|nr:methyltransferase domain-containing protein [Caldilineaceae bacterium]